MVYWVSFCCKCDGSAVPGVGTKTPYMNNRRAEKISQLRQELRVLKRQYKVAREEERDALSELRGILRKKLTTL